ncbi:FtsX-like permease family protein [Buchnera aphidicola]|uniref:FtsX-like permease family protein n=1 Tax=Buchnera aphidicola (Lipaphis pseudobrassicae) TaxID=1258543 RepID=A0A4D6Y098_9GAMM|nr:FtsX-like permease family protein [Buchnera aphidicola]QCI22157.1 FtsX-like permease family protein [Buchnera aphidicola (Lipaphis pseudobrassicae)]
MYKPIYLFIGLRYLWNFHLPKFKKLITILSIIAIGISTASLIIIISVINGFEDNLKKNTLSFVPHLIVTNKKKCVNTLDFPKKILYLHDFKKVSDFISRKVILRSKSDISMGEIIGIDNSNKENIKNYNIKNISNILKPKQKNAILGIELAKKLHVNIGDEIKLILLTNQKKLFFKEIFNEQTFKIIDFFSTKNEVDYYHIVINKEDCLNLLHLPKGYITGWRVWVKEPLSLNLQRMKKSIDSFILLDWKLEKGEIFKKIIFEKYIMLLVFCLILIVAILNIFIMLTVYTIEKENSIAILQSQGLTNWKIILIFVILSLSIAIIGNIFGTVMSMFLIIEKNFLKYLIRFFFDEIDVSIIIVPHQIFLINIISIFITTISTLYPAYNATKIQSAQILSHE